MSQLALGLAAGLTRAWVHLYTGGLRPDHREARRAELESDLWEHAHTSEQEGRRPAETALEILWRLLAGMPADLTWRLEHRAPGRRATIRAGSRNMLSAIKKHGMTALAGALGLWDLFIGVTVYVSPGWDASTEERFLFGPMVAVAGILVLGGLVGMRRGTRGSRIAVALGAAVGGALTFWIIAAPAAALAVIVWLFVTREQRTPKPA